MSFTSKQLAQYVRGELVGDENIQCSGASIDSRNCKKGNVFFALQGEQSDGHAFVQNAQDARCSVVVVERAIQSTIPYVLVSDARSALRSLAVGRRAELEATVIAVTGSVGKTTVKDMLGTLLGDTAVVSAKSFNNDLGVPLTILSAEEASFLVAEVGANDVGEMKPLSQLVSPSIAIITAIGNAHLEGFGDAETILREKATLLEALPSSGYAIIPEEIDISPFAIAAHVITVGDSESADIQVQTSVNSDGNAILRIGDDTVVLSLLGEHNARNGALAVVACSVAMPEVPIGVILQKITRVQAPDGRLSQKHVGGITFIDDSYNANPTSMRGALEFFANLQCGRKVLVLGDMLELGANAQHEHDALVERIAKIDADVVCLVGEYMLGPALSLQSTHEPTTSNEALKRIASLLQKGDTVLLKGSRGVQLERIIEMKRQTTVSNH